MSPTGIEILIMKTEQYALPLHLASMSQWHGIDSSSDVKSTEALKRINAVVEIEGSYEDVQQFFRNLPQSLKIKSCRNYDR